MLKQKMILCLLSTVLCVFTTEAQAYAKQYELKGKIIDNRSKKGISQISMFIKPFNKKVDANKQGEFLFKFRKGELAMTGGQHIASSDFGFNYKPENKLEIAKVCEAIGVKDIVTVDAYEFENLEKAILNAVNSNTNSVVIVQKPCVTRFKLPKSDSYHIDQDLCTQCRECIDIGCLAIESKKNAEGLVEIVINEDLCVGCGLCSTACMFEAINS